MARDGERPEVANRERCERLAGRHSRVVVEAEVTARRAAEETFSPRTHGEASGKDARGAVSRRGAREEGVGCAGDAEDGVVEARGERQGGRGGGGV